MLPRATGGSGYGWLTFLKCLESCGGKLLRVLIVEVSVDATKNICFGSP